MTDELTASETILNAYAHGWLDMEVVRKHYKQQYENLDIVLRDAFEQIIEMEKNK